MHHIYQSLIDMRLHQQVRSHLSLATTNEIVHALETVNQSGHMVPTTAYERKILNARSLVVG